MRPPAFPRVRRSVGQLVLGLALLTAAVPRSALAQDALIPHVGPDSSPLVEQAGPPVPGPASVQLLPTTAFVEDPTRQAGGEDDARRVNERQIEQHNDEVDRRRK